MQFRCNQNTLQFKREKNKCLMKIFKMNLPKYQYRGKIQTAKSSQICMKEYFGQVLKETLI